MERDPNGLDQHAPGAKLDATKARPVLVLGGFLAVLTTTPGTEAVRQLLQLVQILDRKRSVADLIREALGADPLARLDEVVAVGTHGAGKYSPSGWLMVPDGMQRYAEAAVRHRMKSALGERIDPDSGLSHDAHYLWNLLAYECLRTTHKETT